MLGPKAHQDDSGLPNRGRTHADKGLDTAQPTFYTHPCPGRERSSSPPGFPAYDEREPMLRPRTLGKITVVVLMLAALITAWLFALEVKELTLYKGFRAITYAIMALTFATIYRYFED